MAKRENNSKIYNIMNTNYHVISLRIDENVTLLINVN